MAIKRAIKAGDKSIISFKKAIKVGEITQWFDKDKFRPSVIDRTLTFTNNDDGSVTVSGVAVNIAQNIYSISNLKELVKGHKYLLSGCPKKTNPEDSYFLTLNVYNDNGGPPLNMWYDYGFGGVIFIFDQEYYSRNIGGIYIYERTVGAEVNRTYTPQLFDLTEMFGAGHEPATVAEFRAKFPEAYYPYQRAILTAYNKVIRPCARKGEVVQLVSAGDFNESKSDFYGVTYTNNGDGNWTLNGTCTTSANYDILYHANSSKLPIIKDHAYLILDNRTGRINSAGNATVQILNAQQTFIIGTSDNQEVGYAFKTSSITTMCYIRVRIEQGVTYNNVKLIPQLFDLTAMYGAGNEPKSLADFRKDYPESYYPYNSIHTKNLWTCNKTLYFFSYNKTTQIYTINGTGSNSCYTLPSPISAGQTFTISVKCLSGWIPDGCVVNFGGYHKEGNVLSWQTTVKLPREQDLTGKIFTATGKTTDTLTDFWIFIYAKIPTNLRVMIQFEKGSVATDYVPHDYI